MKLRTYFVLANAVSIAVLLICLFISYSEMLLTQAQFVWLASVTGVVGLFSVFLHFILTKPIEKSLRLLTDETRQIAAGTFNAEVPLIGPSEFQTLARQFNDMSANLQASFERIRSAEQNRRELVANVSHDLRTPLASIQSYVEALQDEVVVKDDYTFKQYLATIQLETVRLAGLIHDLFELSRLEAGAEPFEPEPCDLDSLILQKLQSVALTIEQKRLHVDVSIPDRMPPVNIMPFKIQRVFANLLENAIRHSPDGGKLTICAEPHREHFIQVSIKDEGEGIPHGQQAAIFDRFYRIDPSRSRQSGGAGLGLAIAKSIIRLHRGDIGVESEAGGGSRFWFTLPVYSKPS
ncbi:sensor histidine kinase [Paenibacillus beijingensis]|uniref:histidine kinase n=1 Tax=Paenibacillus beijingensis TaxID=1126833 RepID=A0A0D5NF57_9BACL|nr:ATP-binding protein [Paenibacillus beijingensis]AJY73876.1 hypothetical protein VN24_03685 [Paenibacillus beijingensis]